MSWLKAIFGWVVCGLLAYGGTSFVSLGYDWGYDLVDSWLGQPSPWNINQGMLAISTLVDWVFPLYAGLYCGFSAAKFGKVPVWNLGAVVLAAAVSLGVSWNDRVSDLSRNPLNWIWVFVPLVVAYVSFKVGWRQFAFFQVRIRPVKLFLPATIVLFAAALVGLSESAGAFSDLKCWQEATIYGLALFGSGALAAHLMRVRDAEVGVLAALLANSPFVLINLSNVLGNLLSLGLDNLHLGADLGWRALLSAILINTWCLAAVTSGGIAGAFTAKWRTRTGAR